MALETLTSDNSGARARQIINAAIQALDALTQGVIDFQKAAATTDQALHDEADVIRKDVAKALSGLSDLKNTDIPALLASLETRILLAILGANLGSVRPGDFPAAFGRSSTGAAAKIDPIPADAAQDAIGGRILKISGASLVAPRSPIAFDPFAILVLRVAYSRMVDVDDPNNNAIDVGIQWLDALGAGVGQTLLRRDVDLKVQDGQRSMFWRVPSEDGDVPAIAAPKGTASWRPYVKTYGADGATALALLEVRDITFAGFYAPDLMAIENVVRTIQGQIQNGLPFADHVPKSYRVEDLPPPARRGRTAFAENGRAPDLAGNLEPANAGTGVDVTDTGTKWVITGTNQQVQS